MSIDHRSLRVILATLGVGRRELARLMGYDEGYVINVLNGHTPAYGPFRRALGDTLVSLLFGPLDTPVTQRFPAAPLIALIKKRAAEAPSKRDFYRDVGISHDMFRRDSFGAHLVDRICCALGVHPSALYGRDYDIEEAS